MFRRAGGLVLLASMLFTTSAGVALPPVAAAIDLLATLAARSPGAREVGALSEKKPRVPLSPPGEGSKAWTPEAPIPDAVPLPPEPGAAPGTAPIASALGGPEPVGGTDHFGSSESFVPGLPGLTFPGGGGPVGFAPPGGTPGTPGGGGGTPPGGGGGTTPPGTTPNSPVPEPAAWLLMLASFALLGARLRLRAPSSAPESAAPCA